ncbi:AAA family ATPase [Ammoniphilus sp. CFH 90114]|nr:AAA family ATPase [Ammoniphilus sp. CFH 90114]
MTHQGEMVVYVWKEIHHPGDGVQYVLTLLNLSTIPSTGLAIDESFNSGDNRLIMHSESMQRVIKIIQAVSQVDSTVLLLGESGVGKSAIANMIHRISNRASKPFVAVNCGALPENLIEAELFGYEHGSFTGGKKGGATGLFEVAHEGTIFLDGIAELPYRLQAKLLNVLQENTIRKVGSTENKKINVRIIAATNKDLSQLVKEKAFREDLFYRLNVVPLTIPALRERKEDIPHLINYFMSKYNKKYGLFMQLHPKVKDEFLHYHWPGNIRELENKIERMVVTNSQEGLGKGDFPQSNDELQFPPLKQAKKQLEKELIQKAYRLYGNTYKVAEILEVDQSTIVKKLKEYRKE